MFLTVSDHLGDLFRVFLDPTTEQRYFLSADAKQRHPLDVFSLTGYLVLDVLQVLVGFIEGPSKYF